MSGGREFEERTITCLEAVGWNALSTPVTGDWGADVIARFANECLVVQCKDWGKPSGLSAVQEIVFARIHYQAQFAAVVSRSGYTRAAREAAKAAGVHLLGIEDICVGVPILDRSRESLLLREERQRDHARAIEATRWAAEAEVTRRTRRNKADATRLPRMLNLGSRAPGANKRSRGGAPRSRSHRGTSRARMDSRNGSSHMRPGT
jgi:hypothetical protein